MLAQRALLPALAAIFGLLTLHGSASAQYFESKPANFQKQVLRASGHDSIIVVRATPFDLPKVNDSVELTYHEPMPDSIMPRSAVVVGTITIQAEEPDGIIQSLEKYARQNGADWIVSFQEPKASLTKDDHWKVYRSTALLLKVLDPQFIEQGDITYNYYEHSKLSNYASLVQYHDTYSKHLGMKTDEPADDQQQSDGDANNPDRQVVK
jgi:hypothetical protein